LGRWHIDWPLLLVLVVIAVIFVVIVALVAHKGSTYLTR